MQSLLPNEVADSVRFEQKVRANYINHNATLILLILLLVTLCIEIEWLSLQFELFDVSFPEKLLKIVATRGEIF